LNGSEWKCHTSSCVEENNGLPLPLPVLIYVIISSVIFFIVLVTILFKYRHVRYRFDKRSGQFVLVRVSNTKMTVGLTTLGTVVNGQSTDSVTDRQQSGVPNRTNYAFFSASTYDDANVQTF
jgi:hypothetical protein